MGAAWCRKRASNAHDSKSPLDRVIVRCVDKLYPLESGVTPARKGENFLNYDETENKDEDRGSVRNGGSHMSGPARVSANAGTWQRANLEVPREKSSSPSPPESEESQGDGPAARTPVPPPRKKRQMRRKVGVTRPPPPRPPSSEDRQQIVQLLSPPKPRPKNQSTVSLPNWNELRPGEGEGEGGAEGGAPEEKGQRPQYLRPPSMSSVSDATVERVETYLRRVRSFGSMPNGGLADKLSSLDASSDSEDSDVWGGIDDFDHVFQHSDSPPLTPRSRLPDRSRRSNAPSPPPDAPPSIPQPDSPGCFVGSAPEDDWFKGEYHRDSLPPQEAKEEELSEVKKELQSIIYDYNRSQNISASPMEVLPTQPVRVPTKKISVVSITPPPSPVASDHEDEPLQQLPSNLVNGERPLDGTTHSTLLRILRECQNIEGTLEQLGMEDLEMPGVHSNGNLPVQKGHLKQPLKSFDSGLDLRRSLERSEEPVAAAAAGVPGKSVDSGLDDSDDHAARREEQQGVESGTEKTALEQAVLRRRRAARPSEGDEEEGGSSGRSSMTPSLSELEAALSDMLEKSAAAGEDDDVSPSPTPVPVASVPTILPSSVLPPIPIVPSPTTPTPVSTAPIVHKTIPKISVTPDDSI